MKINMLGVGILQKIWTQLNLTQLTIGHCNQLVVVVGVDDATAIEIE